MELPILLTTDMERFYRVNPIHEIADAGQVQSDIEVEWLAESPFTDDTYVMEDGKMELGPRTHAKVLLLNMTVTRVILKDPVTLGTHNSFLFKAKYHVEMVVS